MFSYTEKQISYVEGTHINLSYNDYCELDNQLYDNLKSLDCVTVTQYNEHTTIYSFVGEFSDIWIDDQNHTITIFNDPLKDLCFPCQTVNGVKMIEKLHHTKFYRLPQ